MVHIHRSNRLDTLVTLLGDIVAEPLSDPYAKETIVVSSLGMERWLVSELCRRFGVWTNAEHPLPRAFVERVLKALLPEPPPFDAWDREHLGLCIAQLLADEAKLRRWPTLEKYLEGSTRLERALELSEQIADAFDQYLVYRPDWIEDWQHGREVRVPVEPWQSDLFAMLVKELGPGHFAHRLKLALQRLEQGCPANDGLPERICCFQVGLLPPSYLQLLQGLSRHVPTHLFLLSPSHVYVKWLRNNAQREPSRDIDKVPSGGPWQQQTLFATSRVPSSKPSPLGKQLYGEEASSGDAWRQQPLFSSLCRQSRQLEAILGKLDGTQIGQERFAEGEPKSLLELLQNDIGALRHRHASGSDKPYELKPEDRSISIHACHSRRREIECLRENLLDQFDRDPTLFSEDVLVMLADIEEYAPLVDAVFRATHNGAGNIPYTIADRSAVSFNALADALLRLLDLFAQRLNFNRFMDLVSMDLLSAKFEILPEKLALIEKWLTRVHFAWGIDGVDRQTVGSPEAEEHTLRFGLSRLLLGVALDSSMAPVYAGRAPVDLEGDDAELAGRLVSLCETCFEFRSLLAQEQSVASYAQCVVRLLDEVFAIDRDSQWQRSEICDSLAEFSKVALEAGFDQKISFGALRRELRSRLETIPSARSFLSGGVTFCKMLPLRSIPFRVIAMIGLDDGQFPRRDRRSSFNGLHREARLGDRRVSDEDRFLFGETLLACRERLIITYVGRSSRDDSALPPSVVVEELLNSIEESCTLGNEGPLRDRVLHVEALQPYSPRYFDGTRSCLVSRSESHYRAAFALTSPRQILTPPNYSCRAVPDIERISCSELVSLLRDPSQLYLDSSLHAARDLNYELRDGTEPVVLGGLAEWQVTRELIEAQYQNKDLSLVKERLRASGELPVLALGDLSFESLSTRVDALLTAAAPYIQGQPLQEVWLSFSIAGIRVEGWLDSVSPTAHLYLSPSRTSNKHIVQAWVKHLCLNASGRALATAMIMRSKDGRSVSTGVFQPLHASQAQRHLEQMLQDYRQALAIPLPYWLEPAFAYCRARSKTKDHSFALGLASDELERLLSEGKLSSQFESLYGDDPTSDDWPTRAQVPELAPFAEWALRWVRPILETLHAAKDAESETATLEARA